MIILGIDPALTITGYGVISSCGSALSLIEAGVVKTSSKDPLPERLSAIYRAMMHLIKDTKPDVMVLEKLYSHYDHPTTAFILGQARGVICLAGAVSHIPQAEYAATRIKKAIVGKGLAPKQQVQKMIAATLGITKLPKYNDVTDALALAVRHSYMTRIRS
jgi:crossover junction endodeoxyribonuclease RuvC